MPRPARQLECDHGQRRRTIVESLLTDVFHGQIQAGQHLVTQELADRFGVSHTPIREALITLAGIGVIDLQPNRGAIVRRVSARDVREICQVRKALECEATRTACGRIDRPILQGLAEDLKRLTSPTSRTGARFITKAREVDSRLHDLIAGSCGNTFLANELNRLKILFRTFRDVSWEHDSERQDYHRLTEESHEHLAIVDALLAENRTESARAMSRHIRSGIRHWCKALPASTTNPQTK
ncbi:MAG: GntR family transcriptional regulator [Planctomycetes bacterium]|nr:GntR family transcriptional regulator [Planctomycetota bacterium]